MHKIIVFIPARYASTRFPGKPLVEIKGKPLIQWVWKRTWDSYTSTYILTDDNRINDTALKFGASSIITSSECKNGTERCADAAKRMELINEDIILNVQGDNFWYPIEALHQIALDVSFYDCPASVYYDLKDRVTNETEVKVSMNKQNFATEFSREPISTFKHLGLYGYKVKHLQAFMEKSYDGDIEVVRFINIGIQVKMSEVYEDAIEINVPEDLERAMNANVSW